MRGKDDILRESGSPLSISMQWIKSSFRSLLCSSDGQPGKTHREETIIRLQEVWEVIQRGTELKFPP